MNGKSRTGRERKLTEIQFQMIAHAISNPTRYEVLKLISKRSAVTPSELVRRILVSPPTISHHIRELQQAGLILCKRDGRQHNLTVAPGVWTAFLAELSTLASFSEEPEVNISTVSTEIGTHRS